MHDPWKWVILALAGAAAVWIGWISIQSLMQAAVLRRAISAGTGGLGRNIAVAIRGVVVVKRGLRRRGHCLWYWLREEERGGFMGSKHWRIVGGAEDLADFMIVIKGTEIHINDRPTEVQGAETSTSTEGFGILEPATRTTEKWLPVCNELTVLGRLCGDVDSLRMERDPKLGLLFSPHPPERAATTEALKGIAGIVGILAALFALFYVTR